LSFHSFCTLYISWKIPAGDLTTFVNGSCQETFHSILHDLVHSLMIDQLNCDRPPDIFAYFTIFFKTVQIKTSLQIWYCPHYWSCISGVKVSVLSLSLVDRWIEPLSSQTKDYNIGICCFSPKHAASRSKRKRLVGLESEYCEGVERHVYLRTVVSVS